MKKYILIVIIFVLNASYAQSVTEKKSIEDQISKAGIYYNEGDYEKALNSSKEALVRSFKLNDDYLIAHSYNAIGVIYNEFSEADYAISFYNKALKHASKIENDSLKDWIYSNLGSVYYFSKSDVNNGIRYYKKSLEYAVKIDDSIQITYTKLNIASAYFSENEFEKGILYVRESQDYIKRKGQNEMRFTLASLLGIYNSNTNRPEIAMQYFKEAIAIAEKNHMTGFLINAYDNVSGHYDRFDNPVLKNAYKQKADALNKAIYSDEKKDILKESAIQIQLDEYRVQLERIELENEKHLQNLTESKTIAWLSSILSIALLILIVTLYRSNRFRRKTNIDLVKANAELNIAKEKAEQASLIKTQFVSTITHELRTPLYGVVGITDIITDEHPELSNSPHLSSLKFSARYLLELVNDILQLNKMEEKRIVLEKSAFNLKTEITTIVNAVQFIATNNANALVIELDANIPKLLMGDKMRLSQIIMNLTSNALKFTRNGRVVIAARQIDVNNGVHNIEFKISDTGIGIAPADQEKIFEMFVQISRTEEDYQGTGLGLAIVKKLLGLFGSTLLLESELNQGTIFTFRISFDEAPAVAFNDDIISIDLSANASLKVLVVEDNMINQLVTQKIMDRNNIKCDMVADGFAALHIMETHTYDVILMDINMPIMNGFDTTKRIRNLGITTPIIALTAFDKEEIKEQVMESGMNDIIIKPFEPSKLFEMIKQHVTQNQL